MNQLKALSREPLVHFLLIGALLFTAFALRQEGNSDAPNQIRVSTGQVDQMTALFKRTWLRPPIDTELDGLIEGYIRDEVYYREARAMGLDQDDAVVRQRMRMKLEFLLEDLATEQPPTDEQLNQFMQRHPERFRLEPRLSFTQVFLNPEHHQDLAADATQILARLNNGASPATEGDRSLVDQTYQRASQHDITRIFGDAFAQHLVILAPGGWVGPIYSGYGGHLVHVSAKQAGRPLTLAESREQVEREYLVEHRQKLSDIAYRRLRRGYEIVIENGATAVTPDLQAE